MKRILLIISEYFSRFFSVVLVGLALLLYSTYISIPDLWMGGGLSGRIFHNNFGSIFLENFDTNYFSFFFFPLLHFLVFFFVLSLFLWIYYRHDKKVGKIGFKNIILSLLMAFVLIYIPIRIDNFSSKISAMKVKELADYGGITKLFTASERREILNIYHSLYLEGVVSWRHDPIAVVEYELEKGILRSMNGESDELSIEVMTDARGGSYGSAVVLLKNEKRQAEIHLSSQGSDEDRVWIVYGYKF